ncbi:homocysteine S-methyltransferase [Actinocrinis puniceicyclus]|uniref:Homocysteine S-methyltransferase n=1 Tax=Actinocrinis puniceicyclus TaxID=977794 RepID=A0A8J7WKR9_9ACTN|nr:homocysteine S-methyltransferase [Actinocrinis puniceicyclus]MBS2961932.1 homocysteine S-methyltransferase [Actinocrinis puniceicyclus]
MSRAAKPGALARALAAGPVVLDGGMSNQLEACGHDLSDALWTARLLAQRPDAIAAAHAAYFAAGAQVAITASYQASFEGFARRGLSRDQAAGLLRRSVELARRAARSTPYETGAPDPPPPRFVAASVGPYGAVLADGSEYRGRYGLTVAQLETFHRPRIETLADAAPDALALETIPDLDEAEALLRVAGSVGLPCWLSYTIAGGHTRAGQPLGEAFALARGTDAVIAVGVNCCAPADVADAVRLAAETTGKPVVAYPNSGETWDAATHAWQGSNSFDAALVRSWATAGARLIGGCCRVGPEGIAALARALKQPSPATRHIGKV